jgi:hypothetical protein
MKINDSETMNYKLQILNYIFVNQLIKINIQSRSSVQKN